MPELAGSLVPALSRALLEDLRLVLGLITAPFGITQSMAPQQGHFMAQVQPRDQNKP